MGDCGSVSGWEIILNSKIFSDTVKISYPAHKASQNRAIIAKFNCEFFHKLIDNTKKKVLE